MWFVPKAGTLEIGRPLRVSKISDRLNEGGPVPAGARRGGKGGKGLEWIGCLRHAVEDALRGSWADARQQVQHAEARDAIARIGGKTAFGLRESALVPDKVHQVCRVFAIVNGKSGLRPIWSAYSRSSVAPIPWKVPAQLSASVMIPAAACSSSTHMGERSQHVRSGALISANGSCAMVLRWIGLNTRKASMVRLSATPNAPVRGSGRAAMSSHGCIAPASAQTESRLPAQTTRTRIRESRQADWIDPGRSLSRSRRIASSRIGSVAACTSGRDGHALVRSGRLRLSKRHQIILR